MLAFFNEGICSQYSIGQQNHQTRLGRSQETDTLELSYIRNGFKGHSRALMSSLCLIGVTMALVSEFSLQVQDDTVINTPRNGQIGGLIHPINQHIYSGNMVANRTKTDNGCL